MKQQYLKNELTKELLNNIYLMLVKEDNESIMKTVEKIPGKLSNPVLREFLSYGYLKPEITFKILLDGFNIYKKYFGTIQDVQQFESMMYEVDETIKAYETDEKGNYARRVMLAFMNEVEQEYNERKPLKAVS